MIGVPMLIPLVLAAAAAPLPVKVAGVGDARALQVLLQAQGADPLLLDCNDAARAPDPAADGVWSCAPAELASGTWAVSVLRDGVLLDAGLVTATGGPDVTGLWIAVDGRRAAVSTAGSGPAGAPTEARGPGAVLVVQVTGYPLPGAPVVAVGPAQLACRDDGQFPDAAMNDQTPTCAGAVGPGPLPLVLQTNAGERLDLGTLPAADGPIRHATVAYPTRAVSTAPFALAWPAPPAEAALARAAEPPPVEADAPPTEAEAAPRDAAAGSAAARRPAMGATGPGLGIWPWLALAVGAVGGWGAAQLRRRPLPEPAGLVRQPGPPLFPGGPSTAERRVALRSDDLAATTRALVAALAGGHRVVLIAPPGLEPAPVPGPGLWTASTHDADVLAEGLGALARTPGAPLAVVIAGLGTVEDRGSVAGDPLATVADALGPSGFLALVLPGESGGPPWPTWRLRGGVAERV